jgi:L-threonylcarbamoyladenylate synthase
VSDVFSCNDPAERSTGLKRAKESLARSGLVVIPTDTVYGLAADAFDPTAVRRLLRAKGRGRDMPTPVLIAGFDVLPALTTGLSVEVRELAETFWPGGLTLIFRQQPSLRWDLGDSRGTVAVRVPDQHDALDLLESTGPLAVSSANTTGMPPATTIEEAQEMLGDAIDVYLDAGPAPGGMASTIVDATTDILVVRRQGVIPVSSLRDIVANLEVAEPG